MWVGLVEQVEAQVDKDKAQKLAKKIKKGQGFDLADFRDQLEEMNKNGWYGQLDRKNARYGEYSSKCDVTS